MVLALLDQLGLDETAVTYDDRPDGGYPYYTAKKAWLHELPKGATHRVVLQDDTEVCNDFIDLLTICGRQFPQAVWSLFFSRNTVMHDETPYVKISPRGIYGLGVMMPKMLIAPCFKWIDRIYPDCKHDDSAFREFCHANKILTLTTAPSLVQHIGDESTLGHGSSKYLKSHVWVGENLTGYNWDSKQYWKCKTSYSRAKPE